MSRKQSHCKKGHEFTPDNVYFNVKSGKRTCRICSRIRNKIHMNSDARKEWFNRNPDYTRLDSLKRLYKLSLEKFNIILESQNNRCKICGDFIDLNSSSVDHDHKCCPGIITCGDCIRGLLCRPCNTALGGFKDDKKILESAISYLESHGNS